MQMRHAIVPLEVDGNSTLSNHIPASEPFPMVPVLKPTTAAEHSVAGTVHLHTTGEERAARGSAAPIPPRLTPATVARSDIAGAIQLRGTGRRRKARRVVRGPTASQDRERRIQAVWAAARIPIIGDVTTVSSRIEGRDAGAELRPIAPLGGRRGGGSSMTKRQAGVLLEDHRGIGSGSASTPTQPTTCINVSGFDPRMTKHAVNP